MKRVICSVVLAMFIFTQASCAQVQEQETCKKNKRLLETEAQAEVSGENDSAQINISVVTQSRILDYANKENLKKSNEVMDSLKALKIQGLKIKTSNYSIAPQRDYKVKPYQIIGYQVTNTVNATLEGFSQNELSDSVAKIIDTAIASGSNQISGMSFYIKDIDELENEALQEATKKAVKKAQAVAEAAGLKLKQIKYINTGGTFPVARRRMDMAYSGAMMAKAESTPIESGESKVTATVNIAYEIE